MYFVGSTNQLPRNLIPVQSSTPTKLLGIAIGLAWLGYAFALWIGHRAGWLMEPAAWDQRLFTTINQADLPAWLDQVAIYSRDPLTWIPVYLAILAWMWYRPVPHAWKIVGILVLAVILSDQCSASLIKPWVMRVRPCRFPETAANARILVPCGSGYSFVSSHASNHFALAWTLGLIFYHRWRSIGLMIGSLWASLICWSQIRVGVHFPLDIACGALLGMLIAATLWAVFQASLRQDAVSSTEALSHPLNH